MKCESCIYWKRLSISDQFLKEDEVGLCVGLLRGGVEIELQTGLNGGYVKSIETSSSFFCKNYYKPFKERK